MVLPRWRRGAVAALAVLSLFGAASPVYASEAHGQKERPGHAEQVVHAEQAVHAEKAEHAAHGDQGEHEDRPRTTKVVAPPAASGQERDDSAPKAPTGHRAAPAAASASPAAAAPAGVLSAPAAPPAASPAPAPAAVSAPAAAVSRAVVPVAPVRPAPAGALAAVEAPEAVAVAEPAAALRPRGARTNPAVEGFPDVVLPPGPEGTRLAAALLLLPLLLAIWLWSVVRAASEIWRVRSARSRAMLAHQLGVEPAELAGIGEEGLQRLTEQVAFDELTGVARRAAGLAALDREIARARRSGAPLSIAFVDVDGLKEANDTHGHEAGDQLLRALAQTLVGRLRGQDVVFRLGGDEFVCVLPATAEALAEGLMANVRERAEAAGVHFSYGVATLKPYDSAQRLLQRADKLQYADKQGRSAGR